MTPLPRIPPRRRAAGLVVLLLTLLGATLLTGCSAGGDDSSAGSTTSADLGSDGEAAMADGLSLDAPAEGGGTADRAAGGSTATTAALEPGEPRSLVKTGTVTLRSEDVDSTVFAVRTLAQGSRGEISDETSEADEDGDLARALLTLRVPTDSFDAVVDDLRQVEGTELVDASTATEDVTTQVVDTDVRITLQRRSIDRISALLDQAGDLRDVVAIERELARREADLGSLERRQAVLADQTSLSTITVAVERPREEPAPPSDEEDPAGFAAGLGVGWDAFLGATTALLTVLGAVLPFALAVALLGVPLWWLARRRRPGPSPAGPAPATAPQEPASS